jgi:hypothetical protein
MSAIGVHSLEKKIEIYIIINPKKLIFFICESKLQGYVGALK